MFVISFSSIMPFMNVINCKFLMLAIHMAIRQQVTQLSTRFSQHIQIDQAILPPSVFNLCSRDVRLTHLFVFAKAVQISSKSTYVYDQLYNLSANLSIKYKYTETKARHIWYNCLQLQERKLLYFPINTVSVASRSAIVLCQWGAFPACRSRRLLLAAVAADRNHMQKI